MARPKTPKHKAHKIFRLHAHLVTLLEDMSKSSKKTQTRVIEEALHQYSLHKENWR